MALSGNVATEFNVELQLILKVNLENILDTPITL